MERRPAADAPRRPDDLGEAPVTGRHRPGPGKWDAEWLLYPQRFVLGLTQRGWCEAMGISSAVAEVLDK